MGFLNIFANPISNYICVFLKKISLILLVTILINHSGVMLFVYDIQQSYIKEEAQIDLTNKKAQKITISIADYTKHNISNKEICINQKMYEIQSFKKMKSKVVLNIVKDEKENKLLHKIKDYNKKSKNDKNKIDSKNKVLLCFYLIPENKASFLNNDNIRFYAFHKNQNLIKRPQQIHIPPPDLILA